MKEQSNSTEQQCNKQNVSSSAFTNREGIILKAGMRVKGFITYQRSYMRTGDKEITGTIIRLNDKKGLFVNSDSEPSKNYPLSKFAHNWLSQPKVAWLELV